MISKLQETKRVRMANKRVAAARKMKSKDKMMKLLNVALHLQTVFMEEYTDQQRGEEDVYFVGINEGRVSLAQEIMEILS